jgi:hypothetical protein
VRADRSVDCGVCTVQMDYYSTDFEPPGYVIDGPDGRALRVCCYTCEEELITGKSYRFNAPQTITIRGRVITGS